MFILKSKLGPTHVFAVGVTLINAVCTWSVVFAEVNEAIFPVPVVEGIPTFTPLFTQPKVVPLTLLVNGISF